MNIHFLHPPGNKKASPISLQVRHAFLRWNRHNRGPSRRHCIQSAPHFSLHHLHALLQLLRKFTLHRGVNTLGQIRQNLVAQHLLPLLQENGRIRGELHEPRLVGVENRSVLQTVTDIGSLEGRLILEFLLKFGNDLIWNLRRLFNQTIQILSANPQEIHAIHSVIGIQGEFHRNLTLEFPPRNSRDPVGLGPLGISQEISQRCQNPRKNGNCSDDCLGIPLTRSFRCRDKTTNGKIRRASERGQNNHRNRNGQIPPGEFLLRRIVQPPITPCNIRPLRHQLLLFRGPTIQKLLRACVSP